MLTCSHFQISDILCNDVEISATSGARVLIKVVNRRDDTYIISNDVHPVVQGASNETEQVSMQVGSTRNFLFLFLKCDFN
jgi:hypothetical protein